MRGKDVDVSGVRARLVEAAEQGSRIELILVVRGKVKPVRGSDGRRWRMRIDREHVLTFRAETVVAATLLPGAAGDAEEAPDAPER